MKCLIRFSLALMAAAALAIPAGPALAGDNDGQADLDKAIEKKLAAGAEPAPADLDEVLALCDRAMKAGLNAPNAQFANKLYNSTLFLRAKVHGDAVINRRSVANLEVNLKERELALADLEKLVARDPTDGSAYLLIARMREILVSERPQALKAADKAVELIKDDATLRATALHVRGDLQTDPNKQLADYGEALKLTPGDAEMLWSRALALVAQKKFEQALADCDALVDLAPRDPEPRRRAFLVQVYEARGVVLFQLKRNDEAMRSFDRSIALHPPNASSPYVRRAQVRAEMKDFKGALDDMRIALDRNKDSGKVLLARARIYQLSGDMKSAKADVEQALKDKNPNIVPEALELRARLKILSGEFDLGISDLEELSKLVPKNVELLLRIAQLYQANKQSRKAIEKYTAVLAIDDKNSEIYRDRGNSYLNVGKQAEAIKDYEKALRLKADDAELLNNFAWVLATSPDAKLRDGKRSVQLGTKACEATQYNKAFILSTLAAGYAEVGDFDNAVRWATKAVEQAEKGVARGEEDIKNELKKELESYKQKKPWRELLHEDEESNKPESADSGKTETSKSPDATKPQSETPAAKK